jgi:ketopantoate hydroxymethyltransferase
VAENRGRISIPGLREMKERGEKISMLTAYDYPMARLLDGPAWTFSWSGTL